MQKWDMLLIDSVGGRVSLFSTNPNELKELAELVVHEAREYFSYAADPRNKFDMRTDSRSSKGHRIDIIYYPHTDSLSDSDIFILNCDFRYFLLNIVISRDWLPYPGGAEANRFIRYNEQPVGH